MKLGEDGINEIWRNEKVRIVGLKRARLWIRARVTLRAMDMPDEGILDLVG